MGAKEDLTGRKFNLLTVIREVPRTTAKTGTYWLCECECGKQTIVSSSNLKRSQVKSCGCARGIKLEGKVFGRLTVIKSVGKDRHGFIKWLCKCECGNETTVITNSLTSGSTKSCGCLHRETTRIVGKNNRKPNKYEELDGYIKGYDNSGKTFLIDKEDLPKIKDKYWREDHGYFSDITEGEKVYLHRFIMGFPEGMSIDHINRDKSDNRKSNLRVCEQLENCWNTGIRKNNTSGVTGVSFINRTKKWECFLECNGERHRSYFDDKDDAIKQRKEWERQYYGEFAPDEVN